MDKRAPVIAIDGTCASGKGTVAKKLADRLGFHYLNSGLIYRHVAYLALEGQVDLFDEVSVVKIAQQFSEVFEKQGIHYPEKLGDYSPIYTERVALTASQIAVFPSVRNCLLNCQRGFEKPPGLVAEGRDMGTQVFPHAPLKVYLTASIDERATRRYEQLIKKGESVTLNLVKEEILKRDQQDRQRVHCPLQCALDAKILDSSLMTIQAVVQQILFWWQKRDT